MSEVLLHAFESAAGFVIGFMAVDLIDKVANWVRVRRIQRGQRWNLK